MTKPVPANQLWFQNSLVTIRVSASDGQDGISVLEHRVPYGFSPPLHLHRTEDEVLHVLEGEFRVRVKDQEHRLGAGDALLAQKGVPHTYRVVSERARWLVVTTHGDFERFVRELSRPAPSAELPPHVGPPTLEQQQQLAETALRHGIELVGPPLSEELAEAA